MNTAVWNIQDHPAELGIPAGQGVVGGKYWLGTDSSRLPCGDLYRATDTKTDQPLDVLLVDKEVFQSPLDMERARRELEGAHEIERRQAAAAQTQDTEPQDPPATG